MNDNFTDEVLLSANVLVQKMVLDSIGIGLCSISICKTFIFILLILRRRRLIKSKNRILFLLSFNLYISIFVFALFILDMFILMLIGHMHPTTDETSYNTKWCRIKVYLATIAMICVFYANIFQALHRYFRIVYYTRPFFHRNVYLYILGILTQVLLSILQPLPVLLTGVYQYEDYHCQMTLTNWRGMILGAVLIWLSPLTMTLVIYGYTLRFIHHHSLAFTARQQIRIKRDFGVIRRVFWLVIFLLIFGIPACASTIVYYLFGYIGWWANHLTWLTCMSSFLGLSIVKTCFSPHLRVLWSKPRNHINPTTPIILRNVT